MIKKKEELAGTKMDLRSCTQEQIIKIQKRAFKLGFKWGGIYKEIDKKCKAC